MNDRRVGGWAGERITTRPIRLSAWPLIRLLVLLMVAAPLAAQQPQQPELIDRIAAIVGDRAILLSEIDEVIGQVRQGQQLPTDSAGITALRRQILESMIEDELLYQRARRDTSINITEQEITQAVDQSVAQVRAQFRTDAEFRTALAGSQFHTVEEYRRFLAEQQRREAFKVRFIQRQQQEGNLRGGTVTDEDLRATYQQMMADAQRPRRQPTITLRQVVIAPAITDSARAAALSLAESLRIQIERGADFATLARRFSDDPSSKEAGGDLGFFRRGDMVRPFEEVAFNIRPAAVSQVVRTQYGYHLIWVERIQAAEVKARHILISPSIRPQEQQAARVLAESLAVLVRGGASADSLARVHGDTSEMRTIGPVDRTMLARRLPAYEQVLGAQPQAGQIIGPFAADPATPERTRWVVVQITDLQPERDYTFEEAKEELRSRLLRQQGIRNLVNDLRRMTYINVRI